jgi:photosystem II stability/assembly factor-like uncharacterized protein
MRVCLGTEEGVFLLESSAEGEWSVAGRALDDVLVHAVSLVDDDSRELLAATRGAGLWRSRDGGETWTRLGEGALPAKVRGPAVATENGRRVLYVGSEPIALFRSEDDGETWEEIAAVREIAAERGWHYPVPTVEPHVRGVAIPPDDPTLLLLAIQVGGILRSEDRGRTWETIGPDQLDPDVHSLTFVGAGSPTVFAATGGGGRSEFPFPAGLAAYRSNDRGRTWQPLTADLERSYAVPICVDPLDRDVVYLATAGGSPFAWLKRPEFADAALYRSEDGGQHWQPLDRGVPKPLVLMPDAMALSPRAPGEIVIGTGGESGQLLPPDRRRGSVFVSRDRGDSWEKIELDLPSIFSAVIV